MFSPVSGMMMGMVHRKLLVLILFATLSCVAQQAAPTKQPDKPPEITAAAEQEFDAEGLIRETQQVDMRPHKIGIFWWVPAEYWDLALRQEGYDRERIRETFQPFKRYNLFIIATGDMGIGNISWSKEAEVKKGLVLRDQRGNTYKPLEEIPDDLRPIIEVMKPVFKNMMGNFGEGLQFIVFPMKDAAGNVFADPHKSSEIFLDVSESMGATSTTYAWRFPLTSLSPPKYCPVGKEKVEANWKYCPWHGNKLQEDAAPVKAAVPAKP